MSIKKEKDTYKVSFKREIKSRYLAKKGSITHTAFMDFLLDSLEVLETTARGEIKAELQLSKFLAYGHDKKITASELRTWTGVNLNICKRAMARYDDKIEAFNLEIK